MFCPNCKTQNVDNSDYCSNCGISLKNKKTSLSISKNRKIKLLILGVIIIILLILLIVWFIGRRNNDKYGNIMQQEEISYNYSEGNIPKFIDGTFSNTIISSSDDVLKALEDIKEEMKFSNINQELLLSSQEVSDGITYYKYNQIYDGIPVYKQNIIVMVNKEGKVIGLSGYYIPNINVNITPSKSKEEIEANVRNKLGENSKIISSELSILAEYEEQTLVYVVKGYNDTNALEFIINANTGEIIEEINEFNYSNTYSYTGMGMDNIKYTINLEEYFDLINGAKNRYHFYDPERKIVISDYRYVGQLLSLLVSALPDTSPITVDIKNNVIDMSWESESFIQNAITTMANFEKIYDYYKNVLGRDSYDNKGSKIIVNLGVTNSTFTNEDLNNAMWCTLTDQIYIGNYNGKSFSASLDVLAHEFTHGVASYIVNFATSPKEGDKNKAFETGALNEGYADVMGSLIEGKNWIMGENNEIARSAVNPNNYENPSIKGGEYYYPDGFMGEGVTIEQFLEHNKLEYITDYDNGGVHKNSTIVSHAAYLMYEDQAFSSREEMAKVWYNALFSLSSYSNFEDFALAIIKSAKSLGLNASSIYKITKAFQDTKILENKDYTLKGKITSGGEKINNASIEIYSYYDNSLILSTESNETGEYEVKIPTGMYKIKVSKKNFEQYESEIYIKGETTLDIKIAAIINVKDITGSNNLCKGTDCVSLTIYFLEGDEQSSLEEKYATYAIDRNTKIDANILIDTVNQTFKSNVLSTDGKSFYMSIGGFKLEFGWYYKDSDTKFDWNQPIKEDTKIEMKIFNGLFNNDDFIDIDKWFRG